MNKIENLITKCKIAANEIRLDVVRMTYKAGKVGAHIGSGLSECEILAVLYMGIMNINKDNVLNPTRDRFILSKGHGALAWYSALKQRGILSEIDIQSYKQNGSNFWAHPCYMPYKGIDFPSGSLGLGPGIAAGVALALRMKGISSRIFVMLGDGECDEGSVWESAAFIAHHNLSNIILIVDVNKIQADAPTIEIINKEKLSDRWRAFGFNVFEVDGHNIRDLLDVLSKDFTSPTVIMAKTIKGKGVSFIENNPLYHYNAITKEQYFQAMKELGVIV